MENAQSLFDAAETLEAAKLEEVNAQEADAGCIVAESQGDIDALEEETVRNRETITAACAERDRQVAAVREARRARLEELRSRLEGDQYDGLAVARSPTLVLPHELMTEIFDWHMLMGGRWETTLLVCKSWTMVACSSPRLWSRISITTLPHHAPYLRGSVLCTDLDRLRLVLSRSRSCPLHVEIADLFNGLPHGHYGSSPSLIRGPQAIANRTEAVKLILDDQTLKRCTSLVLVYGFLPFGHINTIVLPLLSSIETISLSITAHELLFIQSLVNLSPALRHIRCKHSLSAENQGVGLWTKRIDSYSRISPSSPCYPLHESPSLRRLEVFLDPSIPLTLPVLQVLKWTIGTYSALHRITAPHLHTLILCHPRLDGQEERQSANAISFPNLRVAVHTQIWDPTVLHMFDTPALEHLSIEFRSSFSSPAALLDLFDGWANMPRPKSLHLDGPFTDAMLIPVLGRLPWLEDLKVAGAVLRDAFWEGMTSHCNPPDEHVTRILVPNLKVLLVNYPAGIPRIRRKLSQQGELVQVSNHPADVSSSGDWTVKQLLAVIAAREQAGCPLRTLACWIPDQGVNVLIGSLDSLPNIPTCVPFISLRCRQDILTSSDDRWDDDWFVIA